MKDTFGYLRKYPRYSIMIGLEILLLTGLIVLTMYAFVFQNDARKQLDVVVANREESLRLAEQLRDSSDDLTKMIRSYAATGDTRFLKYFYAILDIRDGKVKRPEKYEGFFWDYKVAEEKIFEPAVGPGKSMRKQLLEQGFTDEEFAFLTKAKRLSDELVELEEKAIKAMSGSSTADNDQGREYALQLLYGKEYHDSKKKIMLAIDDFIGVLNKRTAAEVEVHQDSLDSINQTLRALFAWSFFFSLGVVVDHY